MPLGNRHSAGTIWCPTGNPDTTNISPTDWASAGGQQGGLGLRHESGAPGRTYQRVQVDSGATSATPAGVPIAGDAAYWKDKSTYTVTNDSRFAMNGASNVAYRNYVAGVFRGTQTPGYYCDVIQIGQSIPCADGGNTFSAGRTVQAEADTSASAFDTPGAVATAPTAVTVGIARGAASGGFVAVDLDIAGAE